MDTISSAYPRRERKIFRRKTKFAAITLYLSSCAFENYSQCVKIVYLSSERSYSFRQRCCDDFFRLIYIKRKKSRRLEIFQNNFFPFWFSSELAICHPYKKLTKEIFFSLFFSRARSVTLLVNTSILELSSFSSFIGSYCQFPYSSRRNNFGPPPRCANSFPINALDGMRLLRWIVEGRWRS